jgi:hypothetical protein
MVYLQQPWRHVWRLPPSCSIYQSQWCRRNGRLEVAFHHRWLHQLAYCLIRILHVSWTAFQRQTMVNDRRGALFFGTEKNERRRRRAEQNAQLESVEEGLWELAFLLCSSMLHLVCLQPRVLDGPYLHIIVSYHPHTPTAEWHSGSNGRTHKEFTNGVFLKSTQFLPASKEFPSSSLS